MIKSSVKSLLCILVLLLCFSLYSTPVLAAPYNNDGALIIDIYEEYVPEEVQTETTKEVGKVEKVISDVNGKVNDFVWGPIMLVFLVGTGIFFTIRSEFFQFTKFGHAMKNTIGKIFVKQTSLDSGAITPFQALTTALAATVGTGNIAGVAGALIVGGPGAIFWMWVSALFGMMTKYAEVVLSVKFRERNAHGEWVGGPMYYIKNGLGTNWEWLGILFSILGVLAAFGTGNMTQVNTIASTIVNAADALTKTPISAGTVMTIRLIVGLLIAGFTAIIVIGGITRIGKVTEKLVPFMSAFYILGSLILVISNADMIIPVLISIFQSAFAPRAVVGGVSGFVLINAMKKGIARGVFSNEAGLGSSPIAHASTSETNPVKQGLYGIFEVFMDTIVICTLTAIVIMLSGIVVPWGNGNASGAVVTGNAFATLFGSKVASIFVAIAIFCFATSTILSWQLYGQRCLEFLTKGRGIRVFQIIFICFIVVGATMEMELVWNIADTLNGLMAIPNLISLLCLSGVVINLTKDYVRDLKNAKGNHEFVPSDKITKSK